VSGCECGGGGGAGARVGRALGVFAGAVGAGGEEELVAGLAGCLGGAGGGGEGSWVAGGEGAAGLVVVVVGDAAEGLEGDGGALGGEEVGAGAVQAAEADERLAGRGRIGPGDELGEAEAVDAGDGGEVGVRVGEHLEDLLVGADEARFDLHGGPPSWGNTRVPRNTGRRTRSCCYFVVTAGRARVENAGRGLAAGGEKNLRKSGC
jgi:hypothetical protein